MTKLVDKNEVLKIWHGYWEGTMFDSAADAEFALEQLEAIETQTADHQPAFAVGEYYSLSDSLIAKVLKTSEGVCAIRVYSQNEDKFWDDHMAYRSLWGETRKPAIAEQIATFQRAEHFSSKGRKLDEFRDRDIVKYEGELFFAKTTSESNLISVSGFDGYGWDDMNADEFDLIQTAEKLQEVGE